MGKLLQVRNVILGEGAPKICVSIVDSEPEDIIESTKAIIRANPDLVEWRVDCYEGWREPSRVCAALKILRETLGEIPLIFTLRTKAEGGMADISNFDYVTLYQEAAKQWCADIFDVEYNILSGLGPEFADIIKSRSKLLVSMHNFETTPKKEKMVDDMIRMQVTGADIIKLAVMPNSMEDVDTLFKASLEMKDHHSSTPFVTISMGDTGVRSRIDCKTSGSCMTFASVGQASAPGQLPIDILRYEMNQ